MTSHVTSTDGTRIAFDRLGHGPPVVVVSGIFCQRQRTQPLAEALATQLTVVNYDRRGRGESSDTAPYAVEREIEDLGALLDELGGSAAVYGHSSGAGLALQAAAAGLPLTRLVLHEPPYGPDDEASKDAVRALTDEVRAAVADGRGGDAIRAFMADSGAPAEVVDVMAGDPTLLAQAATMPYDHEVMGDGDRGGTIPEDLVRSIDIPTLVLAGGASPAFFRDTVDRIVELLPDGTLAVLEGYDHDAPADVVAPVVTEFLAGLPAAVDRRGARMA